MKGAADSILRPDQASYLEAIESPRDSLLVEMEASARAQGQPISDPEVASFLAVTVRAARPRVVVEVGTNVGYGAIVLARAAGPEARVITIEYDEATVGVARANVDRAGLSKRIDVRHGDAITELTKIASEVDAIDVVYIDCVKEDYERYLDLVLPKLSSHGVVIADNVLWKGMVAAKDVPPNQLARVQALRAFNKRITTEPQLRGMILPLGDGVAYAVKI